MITRDTIEEVRSRMDIVDVVSDFVSLKKAGSNYKALSPFSTEKTPSFFVVPAKGIFKDFSSGKGGDSISFIMEHEGLSYPEAIRFLAKKYGVEIKEDQSAREDDTVVSDREALFIIMNFAKDYFKRLLLEHEEGKGIGLSYFQERGFNGRTIEKFELGYALDIWDGLYHEASRSGFSEEVLEKAGLVIKKENRTYDRFRGRVIFPVHGLSGKIVAFGARILSKDKQANQPKYINSPETDIYHKSNVLFGLYFAKNAIRQADNCFLVEGYTDVIAMHQAGIENVVASSGTALTEEQIKLIRRFTDNITVLFDGDAAGIKAALRGIDMILKGGLNVRVVLLPDGEDPDSYSRNKSTTEFDQYIKGAAKDFISFKASVFAKEAEGDPIRKAESIREIINSIAVIPDPIKRSVYLQETANLLKVSESVLVAELNKLLIKDRRDREKEYQQARTEPITPEGVEALPQPQESVSIENQVQFQERETIRLLLNFSESKIDDHSVTEFLLHELEEIEFTNPVYREIYQTFKTNLEKGILLNSEHFLANGNNEVKKIVTELITFRYSTSNHWSDKYHIFIPRENEILADLTLTNVVRLKFRVVQKMMEDNLKQVKEAEQKDNWDLLDEHLSIQQNLKEAEKGLASQLGIVVAK
jgi:DNA primase